jgi:hypothetical protein
MFAKFVPGLATLAAPVAGRAATPRRFCFRYHRRTLWVGAILGVDDCSGALENPVLNWVGQFSGALLWSSGSSGSSSRVCIASAWCSVSWLQRAWNQELKRQLGAR